MLSVIDCNAWQLTKKKPRNNTGVQVSYCAPKECVFGLSQYWINQLTSHSRNQTGSSIRYRIKRGPDSLVLDFVTPLKVIQTQIICNFFIKKMCNMTSI